jgi:glutamate racemase
MPARAWTEKFRVETVDAVAPAVARAVAVSRFLRIGVISTPAAVESGIYEKSIRETAPAAKVYTAACPVLPSLIREGWFGKPVTRLVVKKCVQPLKVRQIDTLVAGAAVFSLLRDELARKAGKRVRIVDPAEVLVDSVRQCLESSAGECSGHAESGRVRFHVSDLTPRMEKMAEKMYGKNLRLEKVDV